MSDIKVEISQRLREFCEGAFGKGLNAAARGLEMSPENLSQYWTGKARPGTKLQDRLTKAGCDIGWLITGKTAVEVQAMYDRSVSRLIEKGLSKEDYEMLDLLHGFGITNRFELQEFINPDNFKKRVNDILTEYGHRKRTGEDKKKKTTTSKGD